MNIFKFELNYYKKQLLIYASIITLFLLIFILGMYPTFSSDIVNLDEMLKMIPPEVMKGFSLTLDSFRSVTGFFGYTGIYVTLILSIYAINVTINIFSKEYIKNKSEFIFTRPVSKNSIFINKLMTVFTLNIILWIVQVIVSIILALIVQPSTLYLDKFFQVQSCFILIQFSCIAISLILLSFNFKKLNSTTIAFLVGFLLYFIDILVKIVDNDILKYVSVYSYVDIGNVMSNGLDMINVLILVVFITLSILISYKIYQRKDILL